MNPATDPRRLRPARPVAGALAVALAALACPAPASAAVHKCMSPKGAVQYVDGDCPAGTHEVDYTPRALLKEAPLPGQEVAPPPRAGRPEAGPPTAPAAAGPLPDAPAPVWDTAVPLIAQMPGRSAWLDAGTLAVTTYGDPKAKVPWMVRAVVAVDVAARTQSVLVPRGFLDCTNPVAGLVGIEVGDLAGRFAVGGSGGPPPKQQFLRWDAARHASAPADEAFSAGWHAASCLKPAPEDLGRDDWWEGSKPVRYLQPTDGAIRWGMGQGPGGRPEGPSLQTPKGGKVLLDLTTSDVARRVRPLPFRKAYLLRPGSFTGTTQAETPQVVMSTPDGRITRAGLPASLRQRVASQAPTATVTSWAVKPGLLVQVDAPAAQGGGLYLASGEQARRVWCVPGAGPEEAQCRIGQEPEISPDGCKVAFDARSAGAPQLAPPTMHVLELCSAGAAKR